MKKELVAYKDLYGNWCCVFNVALSEQNPTDDSASMIEVIKLNYPFLSNNEFYVDGNEIYVSTDEFPMINPGNSCAV